MNAMESLGAHVACGIAGAIVYRAGLGRGREEGQREERHRCRSVADRSVRWSATGLDVSIVEDIKTGIETGAEPANFDRWMESKVDRGATLVGLPPGQDVLDLRASLQEGGSIHAGSTHAGTAIKLCEVEIARWGAPALGERAYDFGTSYHGGKKPVLREYRLHVDPHSGSIVAFWLDRPQGWTVAGRAPFPGMLHATAAEAWAAFITSQEEDARRAEAAARTARAAADQARAESKKALDRSGHTWHDCKAHGHVRNGGEHASCLACEGGLGGCVTCGQWEGALEATCPGPRASGEVARGE